MIKLYKLLPILLLTFGYTSQTYAAGAAGSGADHPERLRWLVSTMPVQKPSLRDDSDDEDTGQARKLLTNGAGKGADSRMIRHARAPKMRGRQYEPISSQIVTAHGQKANLSWILNSISFVDMPDDAREALLSQAFRLNSQSVETSSFFSVIEGFKQPDCEKGKMVVYALRLIRGYNDINNFFNILNTLGNIPVSEREELAFEALRLIPEDLKGDRSTIVDSLKYVPSGERSALVDQSLRLISGDMKAYHRHCLTSLISMVRTSAREKFVTQILTIFPDGIGGFDFEPLFRAMMDMRAAEREAFTAQALRLLTDDIRGDARSQIICTAMKMRAAEREAFAAQISTLLTDDIRGDTRLNIIRTVMNTKSKTRVTMTIEQLAIDRQNGLKAGSDYLQRMLELLEIPQPSMGTKTTVASQEQGSKTPEKSAGAAKGGAGAAKGGSGAGAVEESTAVASQEQDSKTPEKSAGAAKGGAGAGAARDIPRMTGAVGATMFFQDPDYLKMDPEVLRATAKDWLKENRSLNIDEADFWDNIEGYINWLG